MRGASRGRGLGRRPRHWSPAECGQLGPHRVSQPQPSGPAAGPDPSAPEPLVAPFGAASGPASPSTLPVPESGRRGHCGGETRLAALAPTLLACDLGRDLASWGSVSLVFPEGHQVMAKVPPGAPSICRSPRFPSFLLGAFLIPPWKESTSPLPPPASTPEGRRGARGAPHCPADPSPPGSQTPT